MKVFIITIILFAGVVLSSPPGHNNNIINNNKIESDNNNNDINNDNFSRFAKMIGYCADSPDLTNCLAIKTITALNRATRSNNIEIIPGVTFTRDESVPARDSRSLSENEILTSLPENVDEKYGRLLDLAMKSTADFISTHKLEVKVPKETTQEIARAIDEGRRGKMKKFMGPLIMAIGAKLIALIPIFLGGLALLAFKAIAVAKIAFVIALALGASKLFGAGGSVLGKLGGGGGGGLGGIGGIGGGYNGGGWNNGGWNNAGNTGWTSGGSAAYPYARSMDEAHDVAYSAQAPNQ